MFIPRSARLTRARVVALVVAAVSVAVAVSLAGGSTPDLRDEPVGRFDGMEYRAIVDAPTLTAAQRARAIEAARTDPRARAWREEARWRAVLVRPYGPFAPGDVPADDPCADQPCVNVTFYRYDDDRVLEVFVAPEGDVVRVRPGSGQPAISDQERRAAHTIAHQGLRARGMLPRVHSHPGLAKPMWPDSGPCARHRCVTVIFALDDLAETGIGRQINVVVNLSNDRIVEIRKIRCTPACTRGWNA